MDKLIITRLHERRLAILFKNGHAVDICPEETEAAKETGVVFVGKVKSIAKNISAAFIEYRPGVNGFYSLKDNPNPIFADQSHPNRQIRQGDEVIVQVERSAVKTKDAVLTSKITLTGRTVVLISGSHRLGISDKIRDKAWRNQVKECWEDFPNRECAMIVRTNGYEAGIPAIFEEFSLLLEEYRKIIQIGQSRTCHSILYRPDSFAVQAVKQLRLGDSPEIITDDAGVFSEIRESFKKEIKAGLFSLTLYQDAFPLSALYKLDTILSSALSKVVWLKSGGNLVIEPTEALTVIDVNTAKNTVGKSGEETFLRTDLEAAAAIAAELRLRNLSGIILVDFIDLKEEDHKKELLSKFRTYLLADPVKTCLVDMTALGLVEITRKKIRRPLHEIFKK